MCRMRDGKLAQKFAHPSFQIQLQIGPGAFRGSQRHPSPPLTIG